MNLYGFAGGDPVNFSDPFGLAADTTGTQKEPLTTNDPEKIAKVDALEKEITGQWMNTIRATVAAEAVAATAVVVAGRAAIASGVARAHLAIINNPVSAWTAGFSAGLAKGTLVSGSNGAPKPILPSRAMTNGYMWGEAAGLFVKDYMRYFGGH